MPIRYDPSLETLEPDEAETFASLVETLHGINETTLADGGHPLRSVHAKSHALLKGEMRVLDNLRPELAQGLFASPGTYRVMLRLSTNPGDVLPDSVSTPRGMALKVTDVEGERLPGSEDGTAQDFVMASGPAFTAPNPKKFASSLKLLAKTTDKAPSLKAALSTVLRGVEKALESVGGQSPTLLSMGGFPKTNILGETFYSQVPHRFGDYVAKISVAPVSPDLLALKDAPIDTSDAPDALRDAVRAHFHEHGGEWEVRVQLCTDLESMPIEDASVVWPEDQSPYRAVARIQVAPQAGWDEALSTEIDDGVAFSPWQGLVAHRPLGGIMRSRKPAYEMSSGFREAHTGCPMHR